MANDSATFSRLLIAMVAIGALAILIGNALTAVSRSAEMQALGYTVRALGLVICILSGVVFLLARTTERLRLRAPFPHSTPATRQRVPTHGPSPKVLAGIRTFSGLLFFLGIFHLVATLTVLVNWALGAYRLGAATLGLHLLWALFRPTVLVVASVLIWYLVETVRRLAERLDEQLGESTQDAEQGPGGARSLR